MPRLEDLINDKANYPDDRRITLSDGVEVSFGDLRGGYLRDADYRRKTQALADDRRRFDEERGTTEAALTQAREELVRLAQQAQPKAPVTDDAIDQLLQSDPAARRLMAKIDAAEHRAAELETRWKNREDAEAKSRQESIVNFHRQTLARLRETDPNLDEQALIDHAQKNGISRLDIAHRDMTRDSEWASREKKVREEERSKAEQDFRRQQPVLPMRRTISSPLLGKDDPKTFDEAAAAAEQDPEISALLYGQQG